MTVRRLIPTLLVLAAAAVPAGAAAAAEDNTASAVNTTDGSLVFELAFDIQRIGEGPVTQENVAQAWASCEDCRTIAIAVQVLLLMSDIDYVVPLNLAEALNYECSGCETLAYAGQLVLSTGGKVRLTGQARKRIKEIEREFEALGSSDASIAEIAAEAERLRDELNATVVAGVEPIGGGSGGSATQQDESETAQPPSSASGGETTASSSAPAESAATTSTTEEPAPATTTATETAAEEQPATTSPTTTAEPAPATTSTTTTSEPAPAEEPAATEPQTTTTTVP